MLSSQQKQQLEEMHDSTRDGRGRGFQYSDTAIETALMLKCTNSDLI
ncbi:hypothetical protein [Vibrio cholerae]|nr:hypothetical protein [Vibrio cholerae]